jgi:hypothetical protein
MGNVAPGTNFLTEEFTQPVQIAAHIKKGDITAFCTGTGGDFDLHFLTGYPFAEVLQAYPVSIRLGLHVQGGSVQFCDLFWLSNWNTDFPQDQVDAMRELSWTGVPYLFTED